MLIKVLKSKLHRAHVTDARLHYPGSIEIDENLLRAAGIVPYEAVTIADLNNGNRLETMVRWRGLRPADLKQGLLVRPKDITYLQLCLVMPEEAAALGAKVIVLDETTESRSAASGRMEA
jgi:aspartate 1-decarboxylase